MTTPRPPSPASLYIAEGKPSPELYRFLVDVANLLASQGATLATVTGGEVQSITVTQADPIPLAIESPTNGFTVIIASQPYVQNVTAISAVATNQGSGDFRLAVNREGVGEFVHVSPLSVYETMSFEIPAGSEVGVIWANVSGLEKAAVTIHATRALATE